MVDQLGDPLMHMVRNGLDHGLEQPAERVAAGKPATGRLSLRAYHQGGNIYIELTDDGRDRRSYRDTGAGFAWKKNERPGASAPGRVRCGGSEC